MSRKSYLLFTFAIAIIALSNFATFAQYAPSRGRVEMAATKEPVAGATVELYKAESIRSPQKTTTDKKGGFAFAGLMQGTTYVIAISAPNCSPSYLPNITAGQEKIVVTLDAGDGRRLTEDELRQYLAGGTTKVAGEVGSEARELTEEGKKQKAEYQAKVKDVTSKNDKIKADTEIVTKALQAGNDAYNAKNFDLAITKYDEGISTVPDFVGMTPVLLNNKAIVLRDRSVDTFNGFAKASDPTKKSEAYAKVQKDLLESAQSYVRSWNIIKNASAAEMTDLKGIEEYKKQAVNGSIDTFVMAVRTAQVDPALIEAAKVLIPEYLIIEADAGKKLAASMAMADLYRINADSENAVNGYKKILETAPDNQDALAGAGLSLVNWGFLSDDKTKMQEGANLLQQFASKAPDTHRYKAEAIALIDGLKKEQNVAPQKVTSTKKRP